MHGRYSILLEIRVQVTIKIITLSNWFFSGHFRQKPVYSLFLCSYTIYMNLHVGKRYFSSRSDKPRQFIQDYRLSALAWSPVSAVSTCNSNVSDSKFSWTREKQMLELVGYKIIGAHINVFLYRFIINSYLLDLRYQYINETICTIQTRAETCFCLPLTLT